MACALVLQALGISHAAMAATYCVASGDELAAAFADAESVNEDSVVRLRAGRMTTLAGPIGGVSWRFRYHYRRFSMNISGGWNSTCTSQTLDPTLTVLDGRNASQVLSIDDREYNWANLFGPFGSAISISNLTLDKGRSINPQAQGVLSALNIEVLSAFPTATVVVENVIIKGNTTELANSGVAKITLAGGGLALFRNNVVYSNNMSGGSGSSVVEVVAANDALAFVTNNSIFGNVVAGPVSGLRASGRVRVSNNVIVENSSTTSSNAIQFYSADASELRIINNHFGSFTYFGTPFTISGTTTGPALWSGSAPFRVPDTNSPLRDSGSNSEIYGPVVTDVRGLPRVVNTVVDRGAVEAQPPANTGPIISALQPDVGSTTTLPATSGSTQTTRVFFLTQSGNGTARTTMNCSVTAGNGAVTVRETQQVSNGGLALPVDVALDNPVAGNGNVTATLECDVYRENANVYTLTYYFVVADPRLFRNGFE
ncbi:MAG: choice-of-anchor Q domain-containing protein [Lysobacterales bacterium]